MDERREVRVQTRDGREGVGELYRRGMEERRDVRVQTGMEEWREVRVQARDGREERGKGTDEG